MRAEIVAFLLRAKRGTYAGKGAETAASRPAAHDLRYAEGDWVYLDTYLGTAAFAGEEALWHGGVPFWAMNYCGRVTGEPFSGDFLKQALLRAPEAQPYRGPAAYAEGDYEYRCRAAGEPEWFHGYEEIRYRGEKIYECYFHGGTVTP